jgi:hypothetical protein
MHEMDKARIFRLNKRIQCMLHKCTLCPYEVKHMKDGYMNPEPT